MTFRDTEFRAETNPTVGVLKVGGIFVHKRESLIVEENPEPETESIHVISTPSAGEADRDR
jgi:hypothetical protein